MPCKHLIYMASVLYGRNSRDRHQLLAIAVKNSAHLTRYHGVFAPASPDRARVVPKTRAVHMPERGGVGPAQPCWPPRSAVIRPVATGPGGFVADMASYTYLSPTDRVGVAPGSDAPDRRALRRGRGVSNWLSGLLAGGLLEYAVATCLRDDFLSAEVSPMLVAVWVVGGVVLLLLAANAGPAQEAAPHKTRTVAT